MNATPEIWNLTEVSEKHRLMRQISTLPKGLYEVSIKPRRMKRTLDQNAYYFVAVVGPFTEWLREQYGDPSISTEQAHEMLAVKVLGLQHGVLVPHTRTLNTKEFADYVDNAAAWLAEFCEIVVIPSDLFYEMQAQPVESSLKQQLEDSLELAKGKRK